MKTNMEDIEALVCAALEDNLSFYEIASLVRCEGNTGLRTGVYWAIRYMRLNQNKYPNAVAYEHSMYKGYR